MVSTHARSERADCLINFSLSNNRTTVACGQRQCGEVLITRSRSPNYVTKDAISESQSDDTLHRVDIPTYAAPTTHSLNHQ